MRPVKPKGSFSDQSLPRYHALGEDVYEAILGLLMSLKIPPGARITVDNLVRSLGVSQTPIREALVRLEAEGLVIKTHLIGYSAAPQLTQQQLEELYELRLLLEPYAAGRAARLMDDKALASLAAFATRMADAGTGDTRIAYAQFARHDAEFHERIAAASQIDLIRETLTRLHTHVHLFRLLFHAGVTEQALEEHAAIVTALKTRDPEIAAKAMRDHLLLSRKRFMLTFTNSDTELQGSYSAM